jgi:hypothetical protein
LSYDFANPTFSWSHYPYDIYVTKLSMDNEALHSNGKKSRISNYRKYLAADIDESWTDLILLVTCFISGLVDSAVFNVWSCFVSMQTGE